MISSFSNLEAKKGPTFGRSEMGESRFIKPDYNIGEAGEVRINSEMSEKSDISDISEFFRFHLAYKMYGRTAPIRSASEEIMTTIVNIFLPLLDII